MAQGGPGECKIAGAITGTGEIPPKLADCGKPAPLAIEGVNVCHPRRKGNRTIDSGLSQQDEISTLFQMPTSTEDFYSFSSHVVHRPWEWKCRGSDQYALRRHSAPATCAELYNQEWIGQD